MKRIDEYDMGMIMGFTFAHMHHILCRWSNGELTAEEAMEQCDALSEGMLYAQMGEGKEFKELMEDVRAEGRRLKTELMRATR